MLLSILCYFKLFTLLGVACHCSAPIEMEEIIGKCIMIQKVIKRTLHMWDIEMMHWIGTHNKAHSLQANPFRDRDITCVQCPHFSGVYIPFIDTICRVVNQDSYFRFKFMYSIYKSILLNSI